MAVLEYPNPVAAMSLRRARRRKRDGFHLRQVKLARSVLDVEPDHVAIGVEIDDQTLDDLAHLGPRRAVQLDIEAVRFRIIAKLHGCSSRKSRSKKALWTVSPSSSVTTRRKRGRASPGRVTLTQQRNRPSLCTSRRTGAAEGGDSPHS